MGPGVFVALGRPGLLNSQDLIGQNLIQSRMI